MEHSQHSDLRRFERGSTIVRNLAFHRTRILEPVRRIAFRNMQQLGNAMAVHPKPLYCDMDSPQSRRWIEAVQDEMLKSQGLKSSEFNRWMMPKTTFTPVKIYLALLYAELEYLQKQHERYPLDQNKAVETIWQNANEFMDTSRVFRDNILHPESGSDQSETEWLERGFLNRLPEIQQTVDSVTMEAKARVKSDIQALLMDFPDVQRRYCLARFTSSLARDDAILLDDAQRGELLDSINRLNKELRMARDRKESFELSASQRQTSERVLRCMANLHDWGMPGNDEWVFDDTQPKMRPGCFKRAEFIQNSPYFLTAQNRHTKAVAGHIAGFDFIMDAAGILLNESRSTVPGLDEAIERGEPIGEIDQIAHNSPLHVQHSVTGLSMLVAALLYGVVKAYQSVCRQNPSMQNGSVLSALADPGKLQSMRSFRNTVFHVAVPERDPSDIADLAIEGDPDYLSNLYSGLSAFVGSMSRYRP